MSTQGVCWSCWSARATFPQRSWACLVLPLFLNIMFIILLCEYLACMYVCALHVCLCSACMQCWRQMPEELPDSYTSLYRYGWEKNIAYVLWEQNIPSTNCIILIILMCMWQEAYSHCYETVLTIHLQNFTLNSETLNSLNINSPFSLLPAPGSSHSINIYFSHRLHYFITHGQDVRDVRVWGAY